MIILKEVKEIIYKLRERERHHNDRIKFHEQKLKLVDTDIIMYQNKINNAMGKPTNW
tara:strand:+ start:467 stop:637 length:171 start_codon:yes stop_codon:yes gene_type:complete